jgi:mono/diheme cytochrome c family protein
MFGTPDEPRVPEGVRLDLDLLKAAAGPVAGDALGRQRGLYRQHCATCHGISGSGTGPTAQLLNPYPRDFRNGVFKYTSTLAGNKPARDDLRKVLRRGVRGTAMPSFVQLPDEEIEALIEYVKYLSIRGETELYLLRLVVDEDEYLPLDSMSRELVLEEGAQAASDMWDMAEEAVIQPPAPPPTDTPDRLAASVALGHKLYLSKDSQCAQCHGPNGYGDGEQNELYDDWNKPKKGLTPEQTEQLARRYTLPIQQLRPRNFHEGTYRGGNGPLDLYYRIYAGIKGTPMPAAGPSPGVKGVLTPDEIWHVVNYIRSLRGK